jgi:hypothetical protein
LAILLKASNPPLLSLRTVIVDPCFSSILTAHRVDLQSSLAAHSTAEPTSTGMHWLAPNDNGVIKLDSLQLDIVGFLAILGEGARQRSGLNSFEMDLSSAVDPGSSGADETDKASRA